MPSRGANAVDVLNLSDAERALLVEIYRWEHEPYPRAEPVLLANERKLKGAKRSKFIATLKRFMKVLVSLSPVPRYLLDAVLTGGHQNLAAAYLALEQFGLIRSIRSAVSFAGSWHIGDRTLRVTVDDDDEGKTRIEVRFGDLDVYTTWTGLLDEGSQTERAVTLTGSGLKFARPIAAKKLRSKKRGRLSRVDEKLHLRIVTAWGSGVHYTTYQECATALSVSRADVVRALDRERKRQQRNQLSES